MEEPNNDIDTETLQAQIDLAMAETQNLIASWLPGSSSSGSLTQSSSRTAEAEAELQALLRRPPRYVNPLLLYFLLCMYPRTFLLFSVPGWESVRLSQRLMPLRRRVSCRSYNKELKNAKTARWVRRRKRMGTTKRAAQKSHALAQPESAQIGRAHV